MRFIGIADPSGVVIGRLVDGRVARIAPVDQFYANLSHWLAVAEIAVADTPLDAVALAPAVREGARVLCVGLNYRAHAAEGGNPIPDYPAIFGRWACSLVADGATVPALDQRLDWEAELAVIIGRETADASEAEGLESVFGYAPFNDISARTYQRHTHQWTPGKNLDRSGPIGTVVTADEVGDPSDGLAIQTRVNGVLMQDGSTNDMIFPVGRIISYLSEIMTLYPGDVIITGTPSGVGYARTPPIFLKPGDRVEVSIERIGTVGNTIVEREQRQAR